MKALCDGNDLAEAVGKAIKAVSTKTPNPVLGNIKIDAAPGTLTLTATDTELTIETSIVADVSDEGSILVPGKLFSDFTHKLTGERIELDFSGGKLTLRYTDSSSEFACANVDDYPEVPTVLEAQSFCMSNRDLKDLITKVAFSVCQDDARPILKGVLLEIEDETVTAVALDGYRLAKCVKPIHDTTALMQAVVPARSLSEISRMLDDSDDDVKIYVQRNWLKVDLGHTSVTTVLLSGDFVPYRNIIRSNFETTVTLPCEQFSDSLERAMLLSRDDKSNPVRFDITERMLRISSNSGAGNIDEKLPVVTVGPDLTIAFNAKYFTEMLRVCGADSITIKFNSPADPCIVEPADGKEDFLYLILPVRIGG